MKRLIELLEKADRTIKGRHRYPCGLVADPVAQGLQGESGIKKDRARFFFESPDGQNGELYYALRALGLVHAGYATEYHWKLREKGTGWFLTYTEGDIDIYQIKEEKAA